MHLIILLLHLLLVVVIYIINALRYPSNGTVIHNETILIHFRSYDVKFDNYIILLMINVIQNVCDLKILLMHHS